MNQTPKITNSSNYLCLKHLIRPARSNPLKSYNCWGCNNFYESLEQDKASATTLGFDLLGCSTCPLVFGCWELSHVTFLMLRKKELLAKLSKFTKWQLFSLKLNGNLGPFWLKIVVILWICSALKAVLSFSAWEKLRDSTPNSQKLENMQST